MGAVKLQLRVYWNVFNLCNGAFIAPVWEICLPRETRVRLSSGILALEMHRPEMVEAKQWSRCDLYYPPPPAQQTSPPHFKREGFTNL